MKYKMEKERLPMGNTDWKQRDFRREIIEKCR